MADVDIQQNMLQVFMNMSWFRSAIRKRWATAHKQPITLFRDRARFAAYQGC